MPKTQREWARRKLEMSAGDLDTAMSHLIEVKKVYEQPPASEDILAVARNCEELATTLLDIQQLIRGLRNGL